MPLDLIVQPFANTGDRDSIPQTDPNGFVNFAQGYPENYELDLSGTNPGAHAVERRAQNYLFWLLTSGIQDYQQFGFAEWNVNGQYSLTSIVRRLSGVWKIWRCVNAAGSTGVDPNTIGQTDWEEVLSPSASRPNIPMASGGVMQGSTAELITAATDFNTLTTGTWELSTDAVATGSANSPASVAGMIESKRWGSGGNQYGMQRYITRTGMSYLRAYNNGVWSSWVYFVTPDSPAFTGTPTAPTPPFGDNSTRIATTEFVQAAVGDAVTKTQLYYMGQF